MTTCSEKEAPFCAAVSLKRQLLFWDLDSKGIRFMIHELKNTYNSAFWDSKYLSSLQRAPTVFLYNCSGIENMRTSLHNFLEKMERFLTLKFFFTRTHMIRVFNIHHRIFVSFYEYKQNSQLTTSQWFISQWQDFFCWWFNEICCDGLFTGTTDTGGYGLNPPPPSSPHYSKKNDWAHFCFGQHQESRLWPSLILCVCAEGPVLILNQSDLSTNDKKLVNHGISHWTWPEGLCSWFW